MRWPRRRKLQEQELDRELQAHLELEAEEQQSGGLPPDAAVFAARRAFGNLTLVKEEARRMWMLAALDRFGRDLRYAARTLRRDRAFTAVAILTLTLGIGATTAVFSVINGVLLHPLPYPDPDRLYSVQEIGGGPTSYPDLGDWRAQNHVLTGIAAYHGADFTLTSDNGASQVPGAVVSANLLSVLQQTPLLGSGFQPHDDDPGAHAVLLSANLWHEQFHGDPSIVGRAIAIGGSDFTVRGIMPGGFQFPPASVAGIWASSGSDPDGPRVGRGYSWLSAIARLKPGVTLARARADMDVIARRLAQQYPETNARRTSIRIVPELERIVGNSRRALIVLLAVAAGVLLIACVNLANISLARNLARQREIAIRAALGAKRSSVVAQFLTESVLVSVVGGCLGVALAAWGTRALLAMIPEAIPRTSEVGVDGRVLAFAGLLSIATGILFGLAPSWQMSVPNLEAALREGRQTVSDGIARRRFRDALVVVETALAAVLLTSAGLLIASYVRLMRVDPGFDARNVLTFDLSLPVPPYTADGQLHFYDGLLSQLKGLPQVKSAASSWPVPFTSDPTAGFEIEGRSFPPGYTPVALVHTVSPGYFHTLGMQLRSGRDFTDRDVTASTPVVIVNEAFVREFFPADSAVHKRIKPSISMGGEPPWRDIVGVVNSTKALGPADTFQPQYFIPYSQLSGMQPSVVARIQGDPSAVIPSIRRIVAALDKHVPVYDVRSMNEITSSVTARERLNTILFALFGGLAALLAAVGIYGVTNYAVNRATHELGIRMALGAQARDVLLVAVMGTMRCVALGLALGSMMTFGLTRLIASLLYGVGPTDPVLMAGACAVLLAVALAATYIPAHRATKIDPVSALRCD